MDWPDRGKSASFKGGFMLRRANGQSPAGVAVRAALVTVALFATLGGVPQALASESASYRGGGRGALKDKVTLKALAGKIVSYDLGIETLCGKIDAHGKGEARQTVIWPVTPNAGEAPLTIDGRGAFNGKQHESTTIGAIDHVTTAPSPGSYSFSITGRFNRSRTKIEGRLSLKIETSAGFFCTASDSPFVATRR
jgi:hypothetical protein